jgi:hypothetical protein
MGLMNLLKADFTQSVGKVTGARWKGVSVIKTKIDYKAAPTALQTYRLRRYEVYLRMVAAVYTQIKTSKKYLPPDMSLFNWAASKSKALLNEKTEFNGQVNIHAPVKGFLKMTSAVYTVDVQSLLVTWNIQPELEQSGLVDAVMTLHDINGYKLAVFETSFDIMNESFTIQAGELLRTPAFISLILFGVDHKNYYCNGSVRPVEVNLGPRRAAPKKRATARSLDLPNMELGNNISEGERNGKDEPVEGKLGRKGRANRRRKVEKPVND